MSKMRESPQSKGKCHSHSPSQRRRHHEQQRLKPNSPMQKMSLTRRIKTPTLSRFTRPREGRSDIYFPDKKNLHLVATHFIPTLESIYELLISNLLKLKNQPFFLHGILVSFFSYSLKNIRYKSSSSSSTC